MEEQTNPTKQEKPRKTQLEKNLWYFSFYKIAPVILAILVFLSSFIGGILDACIYHVAYPAGGFLCWLIWMPIGIVSSIITYIVFRIHFSHRLLQIYYLQKLAEEKTKILRDTLDDDVVIPTDTSKDHSKPLSQSMLKSLQKADALIKRKKDSEQ